MRPRARARPTFPLPAIHAHQLRAGRQLDDAVNLAIGMLMVLAAVKVDALHIHRGDAKEAVLLARPRNLGAAVLGPVEGLGGNPALVVGERALDQRAEAVVVAVAAAIVSIQTVLEVFSGGTGGKVSVCEVEGMSSYRFSTSAKNSRARSMRRC